MLNMTVPPNVCQLPDQGKTVLAELARCVSLNASGMLRTHRSVVYAPMCHQSVLRFAGLRVLEVRREGSVIAKASL